MGPYTLEQINEYLAQGSLLATDYARHEGMSEWVPITQLTDASETTSGGAKEDPYATFKLPAPKSGRVNAVDVRVVDGVTKWSCPHCNFGINIDTPKLAQIWTDSHGMISCPHCSEEMQVPEIQAPEIQAAPSSIEQYAAEFQATKKKPTQKNEENKQSSQKLSKKQKKRQQAITTEGQPAVEGQPAAEAKEAESSGGWFGGFVLLGICYVLVMYVACPVVHWTIGPDTPEGIYTPAVGTVADEYESNGDWSRIVLLFGTMHKYEGEWDRGGFWGTTISVESDDGGITMTLEYDEDKDTLKQLTRDGKPIAESIWKNSD